MTIIPTMSPEVMFSATQSENAILNLESACQFAGLVAAYHVDTTTQDLTGLDLSSLLQAFMVSLSASETKEI